jgi:hypothetical protein
MVAGAVGDGPGVGVSPAVGDGGGVGESSGVGDEAGADGGFVAGGEVVSVAVGGDGLSLGGCVAVAVGAGVWLGGAGVSVGCGLPPGVGPGVPPAAPTMIVVVAIREYEKSLADMRSVPIVEVAGMANGTSKDPSQAARNVVTGSPLMVTYPDCPGGKKAPETSMVDPGAAWVGTVRVAAGESLRPISSTVVARRWPALSRAEIRPVEPGDAAFGIVKGTLKLPVGEAAKSVTGPPL